MNNIQQTRIQLEKTYQAMGGSNLLEDAASILNQLQSTLNKVLDQLARQFADSISPKVDKSVQHMGKLLQDVKGGGREDVHRDDHRGLSERDGALHQRGVL